jgi:MoxR-like ATPase
MRLDRYIGEKPKFQVFRRVDHTNDVPEGERTYEFDGALYRRMPAFDYFVMALKDVFVPPALREYAIVAKSHGQTETAQDVFRLVDEARSRSDRKIPD